MANLISRTTRTKRQESFPTLDPIQLERFRSRLKGLALAASSPDTLRRIENRLDVFDALLEELESEISLVTAQDLLDGVERTRVEVIAEMELPGPRSEKSHSPLSSAPAGELICYWPGRSLSTGESELASRGFFDVMDRPGLAYWLEAIARPTKSMDRAFDVAVLVWVPPPDRDRAQAGRQACKNGSLAWLSEVSHELVDQLQSTL